MQMGLLMAGHQGHQSATGTGQQEEELFTAMHLALVGQAGSFHPLLPSKLSGSEAGRAGMGPRAWLRHLRAAGLGQRQPAGPAPASKTFHLTGELETLFVFIPGQPVMSTRCQLLWRDWDGNAPGSE